MYREYSAAFLTGSLAVILTLEYIGIIAYFFLAFRACLLLWRQSADESHVRYRLVEMDPGLGIGQALDSLGQLTYAQKRHEDAQAFSPKQPTSFRRCEI